MLEVLYAWGQRVYGKSLYRLLIFATDLVLLYKLSYVLELFEYVVWEFILNPPSHFEFSVTLLFSVWISIP